MREGGQHGHLCDVTKPHYGITNNFGIGAAGFESFGEGFDPESSITVRTMMSFHKIEFPRNLHLNALRGK